MAHNPENILSFQSLYKSPLVRVQDYICRYDRSGTSNEETQNLNHIVLMRHGVYCRHFGKQTFTADLNQASFFSKDAVYRVSHPIDCGDRGSVFEITPRVLNDIVRELDPTIDDHPEQPFPFVMGPCDSNLFSRHRELVMKLEQAGQAPLESLWADVTALQLIASLLESAYSQYGKNIKPRRSSTDTDHAEYTEAVKSYLASHFSERLTLDDLARAVHVSPFHLARIFQKRTGMPIHRYLTQLRLRASLERLAEGEENLTDLALDLGFSSHSHFADTFRREFGTPPSNIRQQASIRKLNEISKNLKA